MNEVSTNLDEKACRVHWLKGVVLQLNESLITGEFMEESQRPHIRQMRDKYEDELWALREEMKQ